MKYYFELTTKTPDIFDSDDSDYMLFLSNTSRGCNEAGFDDNIGMHSYGVADVLRKQLGIPDREMENTFIGKFSNGIPSLEVVRQILKSNHWEEYKGPSFIPSNETDFDIEDADSDDIDYDDDDFEFEFEVEDDDDEYADMYDYED